MAEQSVDERIAELEAELKKLKVLRTEREKAKEDAFIEAAAQFHKNTPYEYKISLSDLNEWSTGRILKGVHIYRRYSQAHLAVFLAQHGRYPMMEPARWIGMFYYRTEENILTTYGGGTHVLHTPRLCNDEEWAQIRAGNIPAKFEMR